MNTKESSYKGAKEGDGFAGGEGVGHRLPGNISSKGNSFMQLERAAVWSPAGLSKGCISGWLLGGPLTRPGLVWV